MQKRPFTPVYLARASYRKRRLVDAQKLLPVLLFVLYLLPLVWGGEGTGDPVGAGGRSYVHVFAIWGGAIALVAVITRILMTSEAPIDGEPMYATSASEYPQTRIDTMPSQPDERDASSQDQVH